jgi:hypothetical protein
MAENGTNGFLRGFRQLISGINLRGHAPGRFTEMVCDYLARGEPVQLPSGRTEYLVIVALQTGDNPFEEEVGVQFRLEETKPSSDQPPQWNVVVEPLEFRYDIPSIGKPQEVLGKAGEHFFTFSSALPLAENIAAFHKYIKEQLSAKNASVQSAPPAAGQPAVGRKRRRESS